MKPRHITEFAEYVSGSMPSLRRLAYMMCQDWHSADDLVQATVTRLYVRWDRAAAADNLDAYVRTILFREFLHARRASWTTRVRLTGELPVTAAAVVDRELPRLANFRQPGQFVASRPVRRLAGNQTGCRSRLGGMMTYPHRGLS